MGQPYVGEIRMFAGHFAPAGWMFCSGQLLSIAENETLFVLIGTTYGGDGQSNFGLPDLRGRLPINQGQGPGLSNYALSQRAGVESVTLSLLQMPSHNHVPQANSGPGSTGPGGGVWASSSGIQAHAPRPFGVDVVAMNPASVGIQGGNQPHENRMPYLAVNFIISLFGIFPTQN